MSLIIKLSSYELEVARNFLYASKGDRSLFIESSKWFKPYAWTEEDGSKGFVGFGLRLVTDPPVIAQSQSKARSKGKLLAAAVVAAVIGMASVESMATERVNYSTKGNTNPYTGKKGTKDPYSQQGY